MISGVHARRRRPGPPALLGATSEVPGFAAAVHDSDDLWEIVVEDPVGDSERETVDETAVYPELLGDRRHERPPPGMRDDVLNGFVDGEGESLSEARAFLFVAKGGATQLDASWAEDTVGALTGHAGVASAR